MHRRKTLRDLACCFLVKIPPDTPVPQEEQQRFVGDGFQGAEGGDLLWVTLSVWDKGAASPTRGPLIQAALTELPSMPVPCQLTCSGVSKAMGDVLGDIRPCQPPGSSVATVPMPRGPGQGASCAPSSGGRVGPPAQVLRGVPVGPWWNRGTTGRWGCVDTGHHHFHAVPSCHHCAQGLLWTEVGETPCPLVVGRLAPGGAPRRSEGETVRPGPPRLPGAGLWAPTPSTAPAAPLCQGGAELCPTGSPIQWEAAPRRGDVSLHSLTPGCPL